VKEKLLSGDIEMFNPIADIAPSTTACKVCGGPSDFFDEATILKRHSIQYFRCTACGFIQTEEPHWIEEAYSSAIGRQDVGLVQRNIVNCAITAAVLNLLLPEVSKSVDYGGGHGMLVRMMRDRGFDFSWLDLYATNNYARGFEAQEGSTYDFLTAFEVLEHLADPVRDLSAMMDLSANVFVSTCIVPEPVPRPMEWWYYSLTGGQHISFYTAESLRILAARFGRSLVSFGGYHLFTVEPKNRLLYRLAADYRTAPILNRFYRRPSLTQEDYQRMIE